MVKKLWWRGLIYGGPLLLWIAFLLWGGTEAFRWEKTVRAIVPIVNWLYPAPPYMQTIPVEQQTTVDLNQLNGALRRLFHVVAYVVLSGLAVRAMQQGKPHLKPESVWVAMAIGVLYTLADTLQRAYEPNRHIKPLDFALNFAGVALTVAATVLFFALKSLERKLLSERAETATKPGFSVSEATDATGAYKSVFCPDSPDSTTMK